MKNDYLVFFFCVFCFYSNVRYIEINFVFKINGRFCYSIWVFLVNLEIINCKYFKSIYKS